MPTQTPTADPVAVALTLVAAEAWIPRTCFKHGPPGRIGTELELILTRTPATPAGPDDLAPVRAALARVPVQGRITVEPGGQIELSGDPAPDVATALRTAYRDVTALRQGDIVEISDDASELGPAPGHLGHLTYLTADPDPEATLILKTVKLRRTPEGPTRAEVAPVAFRLSDLPRATIPPGTLKPTPKT